MHRKAALCIFLASAAMPLSAWAGGVPVIDDPNLSERTVRDKNVRNREN